MQTCELRVGRNLETRVSDLQEVCPARLLLLTSLRNAWTRLALALCLMRVLQSAGSWTPVGPPLSTDGPRSP